MIGFEEDEEGRKLTTTSTLEGGGIFASGAKLERETREVMSSPNLGGALARGLLSEDGAESTSSCESFRALRQYRGIESDSREGGITGNEFERRTPTPAGSVVSKMSATQRKEWAAKITAGFCKENINPFRRDFSSCNSNSASQASLPLSKLSARGTERRWERELDAELQRREDEREQERERVREHLLREENAARIREEETIKIEEKTAAESTASARSEAIDTRRSVGGSSAVGEETGAFSAKTRSLKKEISSLDREIIELQDSLKEAIEKRKKQQEQID